MRRKIKHEIKNFFIRSKPGDPERIIEKFRNELVNSFGKKIVGIYVVGSYAISDFSQELSDIDFIVTISDYFSKIEIASLRKIHRDLESQYFQPDLNGIYLKEESIGRGSDTIKTLVEFYTGELGVESHKTKYHAINPVTWAELEFHGLTIYGKDHRALDIKTNWQEVDHYLYEKVNSHWTQWLSKARSVFSLLYYLTLLRRKENAWCVSGIARHLYNMEKHQITSKIKACEYWKDRMPGKFENILVDTINYRSGINSRSPWVQKKETLEFLEFCIDHFNKIYQKRYETL